MAAHIQSVHIRGLHGCFDMDLSLRSGVNVLYGRNGSGKTTLLHVLANVLNGDFWRFAYLLFTEVTVTLSDGRMVRVVKRESEGAFGNEVWLDGELLDSFADIEVHQQESPDHRPGSTSRRPGEPHPPLDPVLPTAYFPAFRTMIEAWAGLTPDREGGRYSRDAYSGQGVLYEPTSTWSAGRRDSATTFARQLFGPFVPRITYPSPIEIESSLVREVEEAIVYVARADMQLLAQTVEDIYSGLAGGSAAPSRPSEDTLEQIRALSQELEAHPAQAWLQLDTGVYGKLNTLFASEHLAKEEGLAARVLDVYRGSLKLRVEAQKAAFRGIVRYCDSVNRFLEGKQLTIALDPSRRQRGRVAVVFAFPDGTSVPIRDLSSGERQIVTLVYAATHMNDRSVVLIDEPEISLNVDWQRMLLRRMSEQLSGCQVIACTHSPLVGADHEDRVLEVALRTAAGPGVPTDSSEG
ncbi:MAG: AAA family ATPase [Anaerolineae bacterium]